MKWTFYIIVLSGLAGCFNHQPTIKTGFEGKPMPSFNLLLMDSTTLFNTSTIPEGKPIVFFLLNPVCPYCRAETEDMINDMKSLSNIRFYLFSNFSFDMIKQFYDHYQLNKYPNIVVGQDYTAYFGDYYKAPGVPYIAFYRKDKRLNEVLMGKIEINTIKEIAFK